MPTHFVTEPENQDGCENSAHDQPPCNAGNNFIGNNIITERRSVGFWSIAICSLIIILTVGALIGVIVYSQSVSRNNSSSNASSLYHSSTEMESLSVDSNEENNSSSSEIIFDTITLNSRENVTKRSSQPVTDLPSHWPSSNSLMSPSRTRLSALPTSHLDSSTTLSSNISKTNPIEIYTTESPSIVLNNIPIPTITTISLSQATNTNTSTDTQPSTSLVFNLTETQSTTIPISHVPSIDISSLTIAAITNSPSIREPNPVIEAVQQPTFSPSLETSSSSPTNTLNDAQQSIIPSYLQPSPTQISTFTSVPLTAGSLSSEYTNIFVEAIPQPTFTPSFQERSESPSSTPSSVSITDSPSLSSEPTNVPIACFSSEVYDNIDSDIALLKDSISDSITRSHFLGGIVRLAAHDFMDHDRFSDTDPMGSDGCFDIAHAANRGLPESVWCKTCLLRSLYESKYRFLSRADFWIASANAVIRQTSIDNTLNLKDSFTWGRLDRNSCNGAGDRLPSPTSCSEVEDTFLVRMGLQWRDAVALIGAHTIGRGSAGFSGHEGVWVDDASEAQVFDKKYFEELYLNSWRPRNTGGVHQDWTTGYTNSSDSNPRMMLNTDLCLVYDIDSSNNFCCSRTDLFYSNGDSECLSAELASLPCPYYSQLSSTREATDAVLEYLGGDFPNTNNDPFYTSFTAAWIKATTNGWDNLTQLATSCGSDGFV